MLAGFSIQAKCLVANEAEPQLGLTLKRFADVGLVVVGIVTIPGIAFGTAWDAARSGTSDERGGVCGNVTCDRAAHP